MADSNTKNCITYTIGLFFCVELCFALLDEFPLIDVFLIMFQLTNLTSYRAVASFFRFISTHSMYYSRREKLPIIILVGNKADTEKRRIYYFIARNYYDLSVHHIYLFVTCLLFTCI